MFRGFCLCVAAGVAAGVSPANSAHGALLSQWHDVEQGQVKGAGSSATVRWLWSDPNGNDAVAVLFNDLVLRPADVGKTFTATAANDTGFAAVAQYLRNSRDDMATFSLTINPAGSGAGSGKSESAWSNPSWAWDMSGFQLDRIELGLLKFDMAAAGAMTDYTVDVQLMVIGTAIPEPSMLAPIAGGILFLRRKRQDQV